MLEKPHWGKSFDPFMKRRTGWVSTRDWMRAWVGSEVERERDVGFRGTWCVWECGAKADVLDGEIRVAARKRIERYIVDNGMALK